MTCTIISVCHSLSVLSSGSRGGRQQQQQVASGNTGGEIKEDDPADPNVMDTAMAAHEMGILHNGRVDVRA